MSKTFQFDAPNDVEQSDIGILDSVAKCFFFRWRTRCICNASNFRPGQHWQVFDMGYGYKYKGTLTVASVDVKNSRVTFKEFLPRPISFPFRFVFPGDLLSLIPKVLDHA